MFPAPLLSAGPCGWYLDLRSHILFSPERFEKAPDTQNFWYATFQHETAHWVRYQTSSIGLLLVLLQRARALTAQCAIQELPAKQHAEIIERLRSRQPLWSFESGYDPSVAGVDFGLMGQFWLDLCFTYEALFDFGNLEGVAWDGDDAVASALSDAWRAAAAFPGMAPHPGNEVADHLLRGPVEPVGVHGHHLTTRSLWETASALDEERFGTEVGPLTSVAVAKLVDYKFEDPVYGGAWTVAKELCPLTNPAMFLVAVHIATNPALPYWGQSNIVRWDDLYPPIRFLKIYQYLAQNPNMNTVLHIALEDGETEKLGQIVDMLRRRACVSYAAPITYVDPDLDSHPAANQDLVGDLNTVIRGGLYLRHHWERDPSRFIYPSIISGPYIIGDDLKTEARRTQMIEGASRPPLMQFADHVWAGTFYRGKQNEFLLNVWAHNTLDALIEGGDPEDQSYTLPQARLDASFERFRQRYLLRLNS